MIYQCRQTRNKTEPYFSYNNKIYYPSPDGYTESVLSSLSLTDMRSTYLINRYSNEFGSDSSLSPHYPYSPKIKLYKGFL